MQNFSMKHPHREQARLSYEYVKPFQKIYTLENISLYQKNLLFVDGQTFISIIY